MRMKYLLFLGLIVIMSAGSAFSQTLEETIATEVCEEIEDLDFSTPSNNITRCYQEAIQEVYLRYQQELSKLLLEYSDINNLSELESSNLIGREISYYLMKGCENYQRITMFNFKPVPKISPTVNQIGEDFTRLLLAEMENNEISQEIIDSCMDEAIINNEDKLAEHFGSVFSLEFEKEFQAYLFTKCDPYMRWLAGQIPNNSAYK
jgi:hypothetical protein